MLLSSFFTSNHWQNRRQHLLWLGWFFAGNAVFFWLFGLHYLKGVTPFTVDVVTTLNALLVWLFLALASIGQFGLLAFLPSLLIIPLILLFRHRWIIFSSAVLVATLAVILLIIDSAVFDQYHFHLNGIILNMFFSDQSREIFDITWLEWLVVCLLMLGILCLESWYAYVVWQHFILRNKRKYGKTLAITISSCLFISYNMFLLSSIQPTAILFQQSQALPYYNNILAKLLGKPNSSTYLDSLGVFNFAQPQQAHAKMYYPQHPLQCHAIAKPLNLLIIVIDSWRFDALNNQLTPHLKKFSEQAWVFNNHWSGGNATQPGFFSLFYGIPSTYWTSTLLQRQGPALIHELLQQQYQPGIFASAGLLSPAFNKNIFTEVPHLITQTPGLLPADRDRKITAAFQHFIQTRNPQRPFFSVLFYDTAHSYCAPFNGPTPFQPSIQVCNRLTFNAAKSGTEYINRYKNALFFIDDLVGQVFAALRKDDLLKNTVVLITGDHGNEFNDNHLGNWGHASNFTQFQVQTPLLIYWPGMKPNVFNQQTSHFDIAPLLMNQLLGCSNPVADYAISHAAWFWQLPKAMSADAATQQPYLLIGSYINLGIVEPNRTTVLYTTGNYLINDPSNRPIPNAQIHLSILKQVLLDMKKFYQKPKE